MARKNSRKAQRKGAKAAEQQDGGPILRLPQIGGKIFSVQRTVELGVLTSGAADRAFSFAFELDDFPSSSDFSNLFQFWRMTGVSLTFSLRNSLAVSAGTTVWYPTLFVTNNTDAAVAGGTSTKNDVLQRPYRRYQLNATRSMVTFPIRPTAFLTSDSGNVTRAPSSLWNECKDAAGTQVSYYGVAGWVDDYNTTLGNGSTIEVTAIGTFQFRGPR